MTDTNTDYGKPAGRGALSRHARRGREPMTRAVILMAIAALIALPSTAGAQTRDDIMDRVVWPCVDNEVQELDLQEHHSDAAAIILFELGHEYYEEVIDAVEAAFRDEPDDNEEWIYEAGLAACLQNQDIWAGEME